jgi:DNA-directed RNA polymerase subunit RPC12/RpoP
MAVYKCFECDSFVDNDYHPCEEHPSETNELVCPDCFIELPEPSIKVRQRGVFTPAQQAIINEIHGQD